MVRRIVVLGGTLSGPTAAARAREIDENADITVVQRGAHLSFAFGGLAHHLSGEVRSVAELDRQGADFFRDVYGIRALLHTEATALDLQRRVLTVSTSSSTTTGALGTTQELPFDALVFALGAESVRGPLDGENVFRLRSFATVERLRALLAGRPGLHAVVVGGGSFGLEAVDGLVRAGARVTLVEQATQPLPRFAASTTAPLLAHLRARGVDVRLGAAVAHGEGDGRVDSVVLDDGSRLACDVVVVGAGVRPRTGLLARAGIALEADGSVAVDRFARVGGRPDLYACGASVAVEDCITGRPTWWAQAAIADKVAQVAGENAAGGATQTTPFSGAMLVRALDLTIGRAGLSVDEAEAAFGAENVDRSLVVGHSHEPWFPGARPLTLLLLSRRTDGRVLGIEAVGERDIDKRIDVGACALAGGLTVDELAGLDLGYAGAFNATRDVLNTAARLASLELHRRGSSITPAEFLAGPAAGSWQIVDVGDDGVGGDDAPLPGAIVIPLERLRPELHRLDASRPTVVVSSGGRRGFLAMQLLHQRGFGDVHNLAGGRRALALEGAQRSLATSTTTSTSTTEAR
jgi:NADPH-dependent 2,4-dienoyl-CoA reductase/sulfur reductase-like enzyme/rhodanese-related sulfurtransferase